MAAKKVEILVSLLKEHGIDKLVKDFSLGIINQLIKQQLLKRLIIND